MSDLVPLLLNRTYGMSLPPSPTQLTVPSVALIPAVMPKGGMSEVSTEPEETEEEATGGETADEEAVEGKPVLGLAVGAVEVIVMKVLEKPLPPPLENPLPSPPWCL
jgi:hypothetical protein